MEDSGAQQLTCASLGTQRRVVAPPPLLLLPTSFDFPFAEASDTPPNLHTSQHSSNMLSATSVSPSRGSSRRCLPDFPSLPRRYCDCSGNTLYRTDRPTRSFVSPSEAGRTSRSGGIASRRSCDSRPRSLQSSIAVLLQGLSALLSSPSAASVPSPSLFISTLSPSPALPFPSTQPCRRRRQTLPTPLSSRDASLAPPPSPHPSPAAPPVPAAPAASRPSSGS